MPEYAQSEEDLQRHLQDQTDFLQRSASLFDWGFVNEGKRLATHLRVLLHDTKSSKSLLGQMKLKEIGFIDGGDLPLRENLLPTAGLTAFHYKDGEAWWEPKFMVDGRPAPHIRTFGSWWTRPVLLDDERHPFSRKDLVLSLANRDGGTHVDPKLDRTYARLTRQNSIGWVAFKGERRVAVVGIEFASAREIAWELLESIRQLHPPPAIDPRTERTIHDPCECGSGKPFLECHGRAS